MTDNIKCTFKKPGQLCGYMKVKTNGDIDEICSLSAGKCDYQGFEQPLNSDPSEIFTQVIEFAIETDEPKAFLRCWSEGDWESIKDEWPEFKGWRGE